MTTIIRNAKSSDILYIDSLRKKEGAALGFIPKAAYEDIVLKSAVDGRLRHLYSRLIICEDDGYNTGFCYASFSGSSARIFQIVVQEDSRRWHRAMLLEGEIDRHAKLLGSQFITCRVAADLESNFYWRAMGYTPIKMITSTWLNQRESKSKRPLIEYEKQLQAALFDLHQHIDNSMLAL